jgi:hypothetical protein
MEEQKRLRPIVIHDRHGTVHALTIAASDAPAASIALGPGQSATEVELAEGDLDLSRLETEESVIETLQELRLDVKTDAKLVTRNTGKTS